MVPMEVYQPEHVLRKGVKGETTTRPPLGLSEKNIVANRRRPTREVSSRYKTAISSNSVPASVVPRRYPSPNVARTVSASSTVNSNSNAKRAQSAERKRPSTPPSPSTPADDTSEQMQIASRKVPSGRTEGLWPSTMRSLCVSFQSDTFSIPVSRKEKPLSHASSDHALRPSANMAHRTSETHAVQRRGTPERRRTPERKAAPERKATPERKRTPLRGMNVSDQSENSRPVDNSHPRVVDQHRLPKKMGGLVSSSSLTRSIDPKDKTNKESSLPFSGRGVSPIRRSSLSNCMSNGLEKSRSEVERRISSQQNGGVEHDLCSTDDGSSQSSGPHKLLSPSSSSSSSSSDTTSSPYHTIRSHSLPTTGSYRPPSPSKSPFLSSSPSRGMISPCRTRHSSPSPSAFSVTSRSSNTSSVLSFIADYRKGKKGAIEDAHQLRLLYNRYLQWRFANAQADAAFSIKKMTAEKTLYNVWNTTSQLQCSVTIKRMNLHRLREELKLNSLLDGQIDYLDEWSSLEEEHSTSLTEATKALEACTLRLPVTSGARADTHSLKNAICSAVDVMQAIGSSMGPLLSRVEGTNCLVSELADVTTQERVMIDEYIDLLASTAAMQVEQNSLRTHLIQLKQDLRRGEKPISTVPTLA